MRIRTTLLAASIAALPALALAQTATPSSPSTPSETTSPSAPHTHDRAFWKQRHAEMHAKYEQLSAGDKARFDDLTKQIKQLKQQQFQMLGMTRS